MPKIKILALILMVVFLSSCSFAEPSGGDTYVNISSDNGTPSIHATTHENNGDDEINTVGLSGLLADDQHVLDSEVLNAIENEAQISLNEVTFYEDLILNGQSLQLGSSQVRLLTTNYYGFYVESSYADALGAWLQLYHNTPSPAIGDYAGGITYFLNDDTSTKEQYAFTYVKALSVASGNESGQYTWSLRNQGVNNTAMYLTPDGQLYIDLSYEVYDVYDDVEILQNGFKDKDINLLLNLGIVSEKFDEKGIIVEGEYNMNLQKMLSLLAGGSIQSRDKINLLESRITELEKLIK